MRTAAFVSKTDTGIDFFSMPALGRKNLPSGYRSVLPSESGKVSFATVVDAGSALSGGAYKAVVFPILTMGNMKPTCVQKTQADLISFSTIGWDLDSSSSLVSQDVIGDAVHRIYSADGLASVDKNYSRKALRVIIDVVEDYVDENNFEALSLLLDRLTPVRLRKISSIAVLRSSYVLKHKIDSWDSFYKAAWKYFEKTGQDAEFSLRGLMD